RRFLAVHPAAAGYAGFADFSLFVLHLERAHFVGGFGRIFSLDRNDVLVDASGAGDLISAEPEVLAKVNRGEVVHMARLAQRLPGGRAGRWQVTGLDPAGCDLALADERLRGDFTEPATTAEKALRAMHHLFQQA